jgi:hypothetical protein
MADITPPTLDVAVQPSARQVPPCDCAPLVFMPGDTIRVQVRASDGYALRTLGVRWMERRDSVQAPPGDSASFEIVVPPGANAQVAPVVGWATDASGNVAGQTVWASVIDGIVRPLQTLQLTGLAGGLLGGGGVLDSRRDRYVFATGLDHSVVSVGLSPLEQRHVASFDRVVRSVDLSPGGDSLVALLEQPARLVVWPVDAGAGAADTVLVQHAPSGVRDLRVAASGHALVTSFDLVDVDLSSGLQRLRTQGGGPLDLVASPDRRYIVQWDELHAAIYSSDADSLGPLRQLFPTPPPGYPIVSAGPYLSTDGFSLHRNRLYDAQLHLVRQVLPDPGQLSPPQALSPDGQWAYIADWPGYWKVDVQTGQVLERVILPWVPGLIVPHPDGQRLIVMTGSRVGVVQVN